MSNINLLTASASNLQALLSTSEITSVQLLEKCLEQIEKFEGTGDGGGNGWKLKAMMFITRKEKLMSIAKTLDDERKAGKSRGKLHGIPIVLKDQWQVSPDYGMPTTAGMSALLEASNIENSEVVEKLEKAGLIILGKTNMSEFGGGKASTTVGKSAVGGQCQSAYFAGGLSPNDPGLGPTHPGGSSTGSAVAVSAGYAPLSLGTEAEGSVTTPAARAALYALVMTRETISLKGYLAISPTYASPGCMAKTVDDLKSLTEVLLEASNANGKTPLPNLEERGWERLRLGFVNHDYEPVPSSYTGISDDEVLELKSTYELAILKIRQFGADVVYPVDLPNGKSDPIFMHDGKPASYTLVLGEIRWELNDYLKSLVSSPVRSLEELIKWNTDHQEAQGGLDQAQHVASEESILTKEEHTELKTKMAKAAGEDAIDRVMRESNVDVIAGTMEMMIVGLATLAGYPVATMPLGVFKESGRPYGFCLIARKHEEGKLLRVMAAYEATFPARTVPRLV